MRHLQKCCGRLVNAAWAFASAPWVGAWRSVICTPSWPQSALTGDILTQYELRTSGAAHTLKSAMLAIGLLAYGYLAMAATPVIGAERSEAGPARILLMRHAEKTGDPNDLHLSDTGEARAERLATYVPETFGKPDFIFAAARGKHSLRSIETVTPLAAALGIEVHHDIEDDDVEDFIAELYSNPVYGGKTIVICWHHSKLPEIAELLGAPDDSFPSPWPQDTFNLILDFVYPQTAEIPPAVTQVVEPF